MRTTYYLLLLLVLVSCGSIKKTVDKKATFSKADYPYIERFHEGLRLKHKGQLTQAIAALEACLLVNPNDDAVCFALSELYLDTKQLAKSSVVIKSAVELDPSNKWYLQEYAYMLFEAKDYKESTKIFKKLAQLEPNNIDWLFSYAESLMRSNDIAGSVKVLDKLENEIGMNPELSLEKFKLYMRIKQDEKAVSEITKCLVLFPDDSQLLANLVDYYFDKKEDEKAFSYLIKLADAQPNNGNAHLALAQYYDHKADRKKSYEELVKAFSCDDVVLDTKVKILLSMFETQFKLDPEMMELANILVSKYPNDARVFSLRGDFYLKEQKENEALLDFKEAIKFDQSKFVIWEQVLIMEYQNQDYKNLYVDSKKCLEYFPAISKVYLFFGISAIQDKKYDEAIEKLILGEELVVNDNVLKGEILAQKGDAYFSLKKLKEGKESYEKALKLDDKNILYKNNYAYRLAISNTDLEKAESLIKQVLENSPNESHFLDTYGWILFQKGKFQESLDQFNLAILKSPSDKHIIEHRGDALFKLGKVDEALISWKRAKEMGSTNTKLIDKIEKKQYLEPVY